MGFSDSLKKLIGVEDEYEDGITEEEVEAVKSKLERKSAKQSYAASKEEVPERRPIGGGSKPSVPAGRYTSTSAFKLILLEPKSFEECPKLVDSLKGRKPVIVNLEKLETEIAKKIFDFLSGATYALNGNVQKVANNIFIFAPDNVDIAGGQESTSKPGFDYNDGGSQIKSNESPWR